jgi:hypothetical protein
VPALVDVESGVDVVGGVLSTVFRGVVSIAARDQREKVVSITIDIVYRDVVTDNYGLQ